MKYITTNKLLTKSICLVSTAFTHLLLTTNTSLAAQFYGTTFGGDFIEIDESTGAGSFIGSTGFTNLRGLEIDSEGNIFATSDSGLLINIDRNTVIGTAIGSLGVIVEGLAFSNNILYGVADFDGGGGAAETLIRINPNNANIAVIGEVGIGSGLSGTFRDLNSLAVNPSGQLFGLNAITNGVLDTSLVNINSSTGQGTQSASVTEIISGADFDDNGIFYGIAVDDFGQANNPSKFLTINPISGAINDITRCAT